MNEEVQVDSRDSLESREVRGRSRREREASSRGSGLQEDDQPKSNMLPLVYLVLWYWILIFSCKYSGSTSSISEF